MEINFCRHYMDTLYGHIIIWTYYMDITWTLYGRVDFINQIWLMKNPIKLLIIFCKSSLFIKRFIDS